MKILEKTKISDIMTRGVITVGMNASFKDVLKTMAENRIHAVVVVNDDGEFMGVISSYDVIKTLNDIENPLQLTAEDIMTPKPISLEGDKKLKEAVEIMAKNRVHRVLVISKHMGKLIPVGILSATDIIRFLSENI